ncbi:SWI/SNF and RSC complexes subunit ssr2, partial [Tolypocladium capitatum]
LGLRAPVVVAPNFCKRGLPSQQGGSSHRDASHRLFKGTLIDSGVLHRARAVALGRRNGTVVMEDSATYGSPDNGASPNGNPILAQPPLQPDTGAAGDGQGNVPPRRPVSQLAVC